MKYIKPLTIALMLWSSAAFAKNMVDVDTIPLNTSTNLNISKFAQRRINELRAAGFAVKSISEIEQQARNSDSTTVVIMLAAWCDPCSVVARYAETLRNRIRILYLIPTASEKSVKLTNENLIEKLKIDRSHIIFSSDVEAQEYNYEDIKGNYDIPYTFIYKAGKYIGSFMGSGGTDRNTISKDFEKKLHTYL